MFFSVTLYCALISFLVGVMFRLWNWLTIEIGPEAASYPLPNRVTAAAGGLLKTVFSSRILVLLKVLVLDVILQVGVLRDSFVRWLMHVCIYWGFMALLLMHALSAQLTVTLFPDYAPTLNPFLFLRNLFGAMVLVGLGIAIYRRATSKASHFFTNTRDTYAVILLAVIMASGFFLEATKIVSPAAFHRMVEDYADVAAPEEIQPLKVYWGSEFGVAFPDLLENPDPALLSEGKELHEASCAACHSRPQWAFLSFSLSRPLAPVAPVLDRVRVSFWLYYIHFLMCFIGLAYLPFSKFFHILSGPVSLLIKGVRDHGPLKPANQITQRAVGLDACMHCGTCSRHCSVGAVYRILPNRNILPSEKLISVKALASRKKLDPSELQSIQEGSFICTACYRCTQMCPVGINLQDLWFASKEDLAEKGLPEPHVWARQAGNTEWMAKNTDPGVALVPEDPPIRQHLTRSNQAETFSACFECQTCTNVCPVVANFENPSEALDLAPHQIMHSLGLGLRDLMINSRMVWDCVTCYLCQEHCPQGVQVTDILYELKNLAYERAKTPSQQKDIST